MTTVLVAQGYDTQLIMPHRCSLLGRVMVRARGFALDRALAEGADPDSSPAYSLRAAALISPRHRRRLAREIRRTIRTAELPPPPARCAVVPVRTQAIARARDLLEELADALEGLRPVEPRGIACAAILLHDGMSPLYYNRSRSTLRDAVEDALYHLSID